MPISRRVDKEVCIYTMEHYSAIKSNTIVLFSPARTDLEGIMLSETSQTEKKKHHLVSLARGV